MMRVSIGRVACPILVWIFSSNLVLADDIESQIRAILKVEKEGAGHAAAVPAVKYLTQRSTSALIPLLRGMDQANPLAENWLRGVFVSIADRNLKEGTPLPKEELERFALDRSHASQPRKLAFDWLVRIDPSATNRLIPGMLDDPSAEFRREAVQRVLDAADKARQQEDAVRSKELYLQAFRAALDPDQLNLAFDVLTAMGDKPDLKSQLGLLDSWWLIGPFDHRNGIGFASVYPPETEIDLRKKYAGTEQDVSWVKKVSDQRHATLDLNKLIAPHHGAVAYAYWEFESDRAQQVEIRYGTPNGSKLWINGQLLYAHDEYHQTMRMDQYRVQAKLQRGTNNILLKICQNEQTEDWAQRWEFQVRICDSSGTAVLPLKATRPEITSPVQE
jgi:hypothetical protein